MQTESRSDLHVVRHRCPLEVGAGRFGIFLNVDIWSDDIARRIDIVAVQIGSVIFVFLHNGEVAVRRVSAFAAGGQLRDPDQQPAFIKIGPLFPEADFNGRTSARLISVPVRDGVARWTSLLAAAVNTATDI